MLMYSYRIRVGTMCPGVYALSLKICLSRNILR